MCACADAGTTGAVPKWHYSRTKSTRPRESGTFGYGPYKDEPWSMMWIETILLEGREDPGGKGAN